MLRLHIIENYHTCLRPFFLQFYLLSFLLSLSFTSLMGRSKKWEFIKIVIIKYMTVVYLTYVLVSLFLLFQRMYVWLLIIINILSLCFDFNTNKRQVKETRQHSGIDRITCFEYFPISSFFFSNFVQELIDKIMIIYILFFFYSSL